MPTPDTSKMKNAQFRIYSMTAAAGASAIGASLLLKYASMGRPLRMAVALAPAVPYVALFAVLIRATRELDQFQQRVALEAMTFTALATGLFAYVYGQLEKAGELPHMNVGLIVALMMVLYAIGFVIAQRRYR
jgi:hypothetical protein